MKVISLRVSIMKVNSMRVKQVLMAGSSFGCWLSLLAGKVVHHGPKSKIKELLQKAVLAYYQLGKLFQKTLDENLAGQ